MTAEKILSLGASDVEKHVQTVVDAVATSERGPASQRKLQLLHYTATVAGSSAAVANLLIRRGVLGALTRLTKESAAVEM